MAKQVFTSVLYVQCPYYGDDRYTVLSVVDISKSFIRNQVTRNTNDIAIKEKKI